MPENVQVEFILSELITNALGTRGCEIKLN